MPKQYTNRQNPGLNLTFRRHVCPLSRAQGTAGSPNRPAPKQQILFIDHNSSIFDGFVQHSAIDTAVAMLRLALALYCWRLAF